MHFNLRCRLWVVAALALSFPALTHAGWAQVGANLGTWSSWNLSQAQVSGSSWRDGLLLQQVSDFGDVFDDAAKVDLRVDGGPPNQSARVWLQGSALLQQSGGAPGLPVAGQVEAASDLTDGRLRLGFASNRVAYTAPSGYLREAYLSAYPFAELLETFEVIYPMGRAEPINVTLSLQLDGRITGNTADNGRMGGVQAYLWLGGVDTGDAHFKLDPIWRSEQGVSGERLSFSGALQPGGCDVGRGLCSGFVSLYAGLDLRSRSLANGQISASTAAPLDLDFDGQLALNLSEGVSLQRIGGVNEPLAPVAWATVGAVPEPASWLLMLLGLVALGGIRPRPIARGAAAHLH